MGGNGSPLSADSARSAVAPPGARLSSPPCLPPLAPTTPWARGSSSLTPPSLQPNEVALLVDQETEFLA